MSYQFGTELARFTLHVYLPGDELDSWDEPLTVALDASTGKVLHDEDGKLEPYTELIPKERPDDQFEPQRFKVLKPMWLISLDYFSNGGLDYERREGFINEWVDEWAEEAAVIFKERMKPAPALKPSTDEVLFIEPEPAGRDPSYQEDSFYAVFHSSWSGGGGGWFEDGPDFELTFVGKLAEIKAE